jgi:hypothetical protein
MLHWQLICWSSQTGIFKGLWSHLAPAASPLLPQQQPRELLMLHWTPPQQHLLCRDNPGLEEGGRALREAASLRVRVCCLAPLLFLLLTVPPCSHRWLATLSGGKFHFTFLFQFSLETYQYILKP